MVLDPAGSLGVTRHRLLDISSLTAVVGPPVWEADTRDRTARPAHSRWAGAGSPADRSGDDPGLDRRLRAADPLAGVLPDDSSSVLVRRLAADLAGEDTPAVPSRRRRRRRTTLALLSAAVLLGLAVGSPGIAHRLAAWTGIHGTGSGEEDTSEHLLSTAPDYLRAVESLRPAHIPLPPGYDWRKAVELFTELDLREPTHVPATSIKDNYAGYAACAWEAEWLAGRRTGDAGPVPGGRHQGARRGALLAGRRCRQDRRRPPGTGPDRHGRRQR
jgi:hypothetical protein